MPYKKLIAGIYCLKVESVKLIYIGSSAKLQQRKVLHFSAMRRHDSRRSVALMLEEYKKGNTISFEVIEITDNLIEREQYWINVYKHSNEWTLVNVFDAERKGSLVPDTFRDKMSVIITNHWKRPAYRKTLLAVLAPTQFRKVLKGPA